MRSLTLRAFCVVPFVLVVGCGRPAPVAIPLPPPPARPRVEIVLPPAVGPVPNRPVENEPPHHPELERLLAELKDAGHSQRIAALRAIERLGPVDPKRAIPALVSVLDLPDDQPRWFARHPGKDARQHGLAEEFNGQVLRALIAQGPSAAAVLLAAVPQRRSRERDYWNETPRAQQDAAAIVAACRGWGRAALPALLKASADPLMPYDFLRTLESMASQGSDELRAALRDRRGLVRARAAVLLVNHGSAAAALPELRRALDDADPRVRLAAAYALCDRVGYERERAYPVLLALARDMQPGAPRWRKLAGFTHDPHPLRCLAAVAAHRELQYEVWRRNERAWIACFLLSEDAPRSAAAVPILRAWLEQNGPYASFGLYAGFCDVIYRLGPVAGELTPALLKHLAKVPPRWIGSPDRVDWVAASAPAMALTCLGPATAKHADYVPTLIRWLKEDPISVRPWAPLATLDPDAAAPVVPVLRDLLRHKDPTVRWRAYRTLAWLAPDAARKAIPSLRELIPALRARAERSNAPFRLTLNFDAADVFPRVPCPQPFLVSRDALAAAITRLGPKEADGLPVLIGLYQVGGARQSLEEYFARLGPAARDAVPLVLARLAERETSSSPGESERLVRVLARVGAAAVPELRAALKHRSAVVRRGATEALGRIGPEAAVALPELIGGFADRAEVGAGFAGGAMPLRQAAIRAVSRIGKPAVPPLIEALKDAEPLVRAGAAEALGRVGPEAKVAVAPLLRLVDDPAQPAAVRGAARAALKVLDPD